MTLVSCWSAYLFLEDGYTDYWPDTKSPGLKHLGTESRDAACSGKPVSPAAPITSGN